jgi:N4-gp56 family major capsid protein
MAITTTTDTASIIEKRVSAIVTEALQQEAVALSSMSDFSAQVGEGMDRLDIPLFTPINVQDVVEGSDLTPQSISVLTAQLELNRHKAIPFSIGDKAMVQSKASLVSEQVKMGAMSLASEMDDYCFGLINSNVAGANRKALTVGDPLADLAEAKRLLDENNVPKAGRYVTATPAFIQSLMGDSNVINADKYGSSNAIQAGYVTRIYGFSLLESSSSSIIDGGFQAYHQNAIGCARQLGVKFEKERRVLGLRDDYVMSHLYGAVNRDPSGLRMAVFDADGV